MGEEVKTLRESKIESKQQRKRKLDDTDIEDVEISNHTESKGRRTRSQYRTRSEASTINVDENPDDVGDGDFVPGGLHSLLLMMPL